MIGKTTLTTETRRHGENQNRGWGDLVIGKLTNLGNRGVCRDFFRWSSLCNFRSSGFAFPTDGSVAFFQGVEFLVGKLLDVDEIVIRGMVRADQLVQLQVQSFRVTVLRVLDQEDHQECDDRGPSIDDELPGVRVLEVGSGDSPEDDNKDRRQKHVRVAHNLGRLAGKTAEPEIEAMGLLDQFFGLMIRGPARLRHAGVRWWNSSIRCLPPVLTFAKVRFRYNLRDRAYVTVLR